MSEQPLSDQPINPPDKGWDQVATQYKEWHPALHEHVERLLSDQGITPIEEAPAYDLAELEVDLALPRWEVHSQVQKGEREEAYYGAGEFKALLAGEKLDAALNGLKNGRFRALDTETAEDLLRLDKSLELRTELGSFSDLNEALAVKLIDQRNAFSVFQHRDSFKTFDSEALAVRAIDAGYGMSLMHLTDKIQDIEPGVLLDALERAEDYDVILMGLKVGIFKDIDQQDLVNKLVAQGKAAQVVFAAESLPNVDLKALGKVLEQGEEVENFFPVLYKPDEFPDVDHDMLFRKATDLGNSDTRYSLAYIAGLGGVSNEAITHLADTCVANNETTIALYIERFPEGTIDYQKLADVMIAKGVTDDPGDLGTLMVKIDHFRNLNSATFDKLYGSDTDQSRVSALRALPSFTSLSAEAAGQFIDTAGQRGIPAEFPDKFELSKDDILAMYRHLPDGVGYYTLAEHADNFPDAQREIIDALINNDLYGSYGAGRLYENIEKFDAVSKGELAQVLLGGDAIAIHYLISRADFLELDVDSLASLMRTSENHAVQLLAEDQQLLFLLPMNGPYGPVFGKACLKMLLESENPEKTMQEIHSISSQQSLWSRNLRMSQIAAGSVSEKGFLENYVVSDVPLAFPSVAGVGEYSTARKIENFAALSLEEKKMLLRPELESTLDDVSLGSKDVVTFTELTEDWQENVLAYRLYESIAKSRDSDLRAEASERNRL